MSVEQNAGSTNAEQIESWNGITGTKWVANQDRLDRMLAPFSKALLDTAQVKAGERVLDIGCGCGATTLDFARAVGPAGKILGVDVSAPMVARARERASAEDSHVEFRLADASVFPFEPGAFDILVSRFGVMFFDEPTTAFTNLHSALATGARLTFICWRQVGENPWVTLPLRAALAHVAPPEPSVPGAPGPFAFADGAHVTSVLSRAGFRDIALTPFDAPLLIGSAGPDAIEEGLQQSMEIGPVSRLIAGEAANVRERVKESIRKELANHLTADGLLLGGAVWIVTAQA
jgi:SAM-dependent methyltransferase